VAFHTPSAPSPDALGDGVSLGDPAAKPVTTAGNRLRFQKRLTLPAWRVGHSEEVAATNDEDTLGLGCATEHISYDREQLGFIIGFIKNGVE
jgi:hypothetical protein